MMALCLADSIIRSPLVNGRLANFDALADTVHRLTTSNLRRRVILKKALPHNWNESLAELVARELSNRITDKCLDALPVSPRFVFCATDLAFGVNWIYSRDKIGDYEAGYTRSHGGQITMAWATAASACFPPVFKPMKPRVDAGSLKGGDAQGPEANDCRKALRLSDGGVYDNMGLEPVWKHANRLLVSDAGGLFEFESNRGTVPTLQRYQAIVGNQARAIRKRWLMASFLSKPENADAPTLTGSYWATSSTRASFDKKDTAGYSEKAAHAISSIRTDLNDFSEGETAALENHGYLLADIAIKTYVPDLYNHDSVPRPPYPEWMDEGKVLVALKGSSKRPILS